MNLAFIAAGAIRGHTIAMENATVMNVPVHAGSLVVTDESILSGMPVVSGTRVPAETVLAEIRTGKSRFDIFRA